MKLILNDGTKVERTLEELLDFLKEYKNLAKNDMKIEPIYPYPDYPINPITHPQVWYGLSSKNECEGCPVYEKLKKSETVIGDGCSFCSKYPYKVTCGDQNISLTNDLNKQPFDEYASGLPVREAMTGSDNFSIAKKQYNEKLKDWGVLKADLLKQDTRPKTKEEAEQILKGCGVMREDGTIVDEYQGMIKEIDK